MNGNIVLVISTLLIFTAAIVFLGMVFSLFCKNSIQGIQNAMIIAVPSFMLSGFTWPVMAMPEFVQKLSHLLPLTYFLNAIKIIKEIMIATAATANPILYAPLSEVRYR